MPNPLNNSPLSRMENGIAKPKNKKKTLKRLWSYLKKYWFSFFLSIVLTIISSLLELIGPLLSGEIIDLIAEAELNLINIDMHKVLIYCLLMFLTYFLSAFIIYFVSLIMSKISKNIVYQMRKDTFNSLMNASINYFDLRPVGDIISVVSYDIDTVNTSLSSDIVQIVSSIFTVLFSFIMMMIIKPILVLIFVFTIPLCLLFSKKLVKKTRTLYSKKSEELGLMNGYSEEMVTGIKTIKAYSKEDQIINEYQKVNAKATASYYKAEYYGCFMGPGVNFFTNISLSLVCIFGALLNLFQGFSYGSIAKFVQYARKFSGPINETANIFTDLQSSLSASERVFELIDIDKEKEDDINYVELSKIEGNIYFENVKFSYVKNHPIINNLTLNVKKGQQIAIVGPTGAGKTTIVNLLMRFYEIDDGAIYLDQININKIKKSTLRKSFAMVLQETWLFEGTVYDNLTYGNEKVNLNEVIEACKKSHIHEYIISLKDGYNTVLKEGGVNISKGQKQLLTIARAMLMNSEMLILDEATSNVDTRTELYIQEAMKSLMKDKTCFIIAHRLSTIKNADNILVLNNGDIVENGNHQTLMKKKGIYYSLYNSQFD